jgi:hypothetical protein
MVKIRNGARALGLILAKDSSATDGTVNLEPTDRNYLDRCRNGLIELLATGKEKAEKKLNLSKSEYDRALETSFDVQLEMFGEDGKPTTAVDANGKAITRQKDWRNDEAPEGIDPEDGEQLPLEETSEVVASEPTPEPNPSLWTVAPGVPQQVESGLILAVEKGLTYAKAVSGVSKATTLAKFEVEGHLDTLIKQGKILRDGQKLSLPPEPVETVPPDSRIAEVLLSKMHLADKSAIIEATAMELLLSADEVQRDWEQLLFAGRIRRTPNGWQAVTEEPEQAESA